MMLHGINSHLLELRHEEFECLLGCRTDVHWEQNKVTKDLERKQHEQKQPPRQIKIHY